MLKRLSDGHELGEFVGTTRNTYVNPVNVAQFKHKVCPPVLHDFVLHHLNLSTKRIQPVSVCSTIKHLLEKIGEKIEKPFFGGGKLKTPLFFTNPSLGSLDPQPHPSFFRIILPSKWTGVSLKSSRRHWEETTPGEEKVNQLFNTNCNK
jgi:hypothetical protein